jgi:hypothetical protein
LGIAWCTVCAGLSFVDGNFATNCTDGIVQIQLLIFITYLFAERPILEIRLFARLTAIADFHIKETVVYLYIHGEPG